MSGLREPTPAGAQTICEAERPSPPHTITLSLDEPSGPATRE
jgi:hypothetical protein